MNIYFKNIEFLADVNPIKKGCKIDFKKSLTFLVGDNGVGKSTVLDCISDYFNHKDDTYLKRSNLKKSISAEIDYDKGKFPFKYVDFHSGDRKFSGSFGDNISLQLGHMKASSGQVSMSLLAANELHKIKNGLIVLDEPERGLSMKNQYLICKILFKLLMNGSQIILSTHSDIILNNFEDIAYYFSIDKFEETNYKDYIKTQKT